jgi:hypothetical protein
MVKGNKNGMVKTIPYNAARSFNGKNNGRKAVTLSRRSKDNVTVEVLPCGQMQKTPHPALRATFPLGAMSSSRYGIAFQLLQNLIRRAG